MTRDDRTEAQRPAIDAHPFDEADNDGIQNGRHDRSDLMDKTLAPLQFDPDLWKNSTPQLCILSPEDGCWELDVGSQIFNIGRAPESQLCLPYKSISRRHARIVREEGSYFVEDLSSVGGTLVNGKAISSNELVMLRHGDCIQLSRVMIQFRRDERHINNSNAPMQFSRIPSSVGLRLRLVHCLPGSIFDMGDTLLVGKGGGISIPLATSLPTDKVVELEMSYPDGRWVRVLCEVIIVNPLEDRFITFLKLHKLTPQEHNDIIRDSQRDPWIPIEND